MVINLIVAVQIITIMHSLSAAHLKTVSVQFLSYILVQLYCGGLLSHPL